MVALNSRDYRDVDIFRVCSLQTSAPPRKARVMLLVLLRYATRIDITEFDTSFLNLATYGKPKTSTSLASTSYYKGGSVRWPSCPPSCQPSSVTLVYLIISLLSEEMYIDRSIELWVRSMPEVVLHLDCNKIASFTTWKCTLIKISLRWQNNHPYLQHDSRVHVKIQDFKIVYFSRENDWVVKWQQTLRFPLKVQDSCENAWVT